MEKIYECIAIFSNEEGDNLKNNVENFKGYFKGIKARFEELGDKKFAYSVRKHTHGYCIASRFIGTEDIRDRIMSAMVNDKNIIKYIVVLCEVEETELEIKKIEDYMQQEEIANQENKSEASKVVYVLSEKELDYACGNEPWFGVLGVFGNLEHAQRVMMEEFEEEKENFDMVEYRENKTDDMKKVLFYGEHGNWEHYIELEIKEYIVE